VTFPDFYTPADFSPENPGDVARRGEVLSLYATFLRSVHEDRGKTLERTVYRVALEARAEGRYVAVIGSPERPPDANVVLNDVPVAEALDLILIAREGTVALEDKNLREWLGPSSLEVWALIGKALRHDALPVLICRKVTYDTFLLFKQVGGLAYQMHSQLFPHGFEERLARVRHADGVRDPVEVAANAFAIHLLAPEALFAGAWRGDVRALMMEFGISFEAARHHLANYDLLPFAEPITGVPTTASDAWKAAESSELWYLAFDEIPIERRHTVAKLAFELWTTNRITTSRLREALRVALPHHHLIELAALYLDSIPA
jgi:hypothetical protein